MKVLFPVDVMSSISGTEKVSINGTSLSFLLYECISSGFSQEGFLIGDVTSEITNHISDSQNDNTRLDTQIVIRTVLPLPSVSLFYLPSGRIKEDVLAELLSKTSSEVVGWYKFRKNSSIKPTFRDKLICKGLQKYFDKHHGKKHFVMCNVSHRKSQSYSTHTLTYRFGKINCFDLYEYVEDITPNLGEKLTGYKKPQNISPHGVFNKIVKECNIQAHDGNEAILRIQEAVNIRLSNEAKIAVKNESIIRELETEIRQLTDILSERQLSDLEAEHQKMIDDKLLTNNEEIAMEYVNALKAQSQVDILNISNTMMSSNHSPDSMCQIIESPKARSPSPLLISSTITKKPVLNYASALKNRLEAPSTSKTNHISQDLITFDVDDKPGIMPAITIEEVKCLGDSSPEY